MQAEKTILQVARLSGLAHDLGKASKHFQHKLEQAAKHGTITKDETRHEWISTKLYQALRQSSYDWEKAWSMMARDLSRLKLPFQVDLHNYGLRNLIDVVDFAVLTHHGLLGPSERKNYGVTPDASKHTKRPRGEGRKDVWKSAGTLPEELLEDLAHGTSQLELNTSYGDDHYCWQGIVVIARASLILADHEVSAQNVIKPKKNGRLYANTNQDHLGKAKLNQPLEWHLSQVSQRSVEIVSYFFHPQLPGISLGSRQAILKSSENSRFQWQDDAVDHLRQFISECDQQPTLVLNMAGTGSGKTLMNVKALAALRTSQEPLRIASGFNLRTLTLQTHSALKQMLSLEEDEISCVIGDRLSKIMHEQQIDEEEVEEVEIETFGKIRSLPTWLEGFIQSKPALRELVGSPVLVSTMDYLVKAGEPGTQAHHGHALLRVASSDLILDEVDSYDPNSLVAVLRVVQMSALFGRNVIASSATLSQPIAKALVKAYASGIRIRGSMEQSTPAFRLSLIDDVLPPESVALVPEQTEGWLDSFQSRQNQLVQEIAQRPVYRKPVILDVNPPPENDPSKETAFQTMWRCIESSIPHFHKLHAWKFNEQKEFRLA